MLRAILLKHDPLKKKHKFWYTLALWTYYYFAIQLTHLDPLRNFGSINLKTSKQMNGQCELIKRALEKNETICERTSQQ